MDPFLAGGKRAFAQAGAALHFQSPPDIGLVKMKTGTRLQSLR